MSTNGRLSLNARGCAARHLRKIERSDRAALSYCASTAKLLALVAVAQVSVSFAPCEHKDAAVLDVDGICSQAFPGNAADRLSVADREFPTVPRTAEHPTLEPMAVIAWRRREECPAHRPEADRRALVGARVTDGEKPVWRPNHADLAARDFIDPKVPKLEVGRQATIVPKPTANHTGRLRLEDAT